MNCFECRFCSGNVTVSLGYGENAILSKCVLLLTVFVKKRYLSNWVFTAMQSLHIRMNSSLSPPIKKSWMRLWRQCVYYYPILSCFLKMTFISDYCCSFKSYCPYRKPIQRCV